MRAVTIKSSKNPASLPTEYLISGLVEVAA